MDCNVDELFINQDEAMLKKYLACTSDKFGNTLTQRLYCHM